MAEAKPTPSDLLVQAEKSMDILLGMDALADAGDVLARDEWLDARAERVEAPGDKGKVRLVRRVTASNAGKIVGAKPFKSSPSMEEYARQVATGEDKLPLANVVRARWGHYMEPVAIRAVRDTFGHPTVGCNRMYVDQQDPSISCTLDGVIIPSDDTFGSDYSLCHALVEKREDGEVLDVEWAERIARYLQKKIGSVGVLEIKTTGGYWVDKSLKTEPSEHSETWGCPEVWAHQVQVQMNICGLDWGMLAAVTQGNALRCWIVERDQKWYDEVFRPAVFQFQGALEGYEYEHDQMMSAKESDDE